MDVYELVGYRRLYDSKACSLPQDMDSLELDFSLGEDLIGRVYMGPKPRFGIAVHEADKYIDPTKGMMGNMLKASFHSDARESAWPGTFFTEVATYKCVAVPREMSEQFHNKVASSNDLILQIAEENQQQLKAYNDLVSGLIGLRIHRQFTLELINENFVALRDSDHAIRFNGPVLEVLEGLTLNQNGVDQLQGLFGSIGKSNAKALDAASAVLGWMMRAWSERDSVNKFVSLFIPLEVILNQVTLKSSKDERRMLKRIRQLLKSYGGDEAEALRSTFDRLAERNRPSLEKRFESLAEKAALDGWEADIKAFAHFNRVRNALVHRGNSRVELRVSVEESDLRTLEDLTERYVSYALFRDVRVYSSRWRPQVTVQQTDVNDGGG